MNKTINTIHNKQKYDSEIELFFLMFTKIFEFFFKGNLYEIFVGFVCVCVCVDFNRN